MNIQCACKTVGYYAVQANCSSMSPPGQNSNTGVSERSQMWDSSHERTPPLSHSKVARSTPGARTPLGWTATGEGSGGSVSRMCAPWGKPSSLWLLYFSTRTTRLNEKLARKNCPGGFCKSLGQYSNLRESVLEHGCYGPPRDRRQVRRSPDGLFHPRMGRKLRETCSLSGTVSF